ncbi:AAA family ATPase [Halobacteriales archaeon SW_12_71_31]|nr:MAG: AAA family ATPase [Halobacteriales archaeon SW_12_71_31]
MSVTLRVGEGDALETEDGAVHMDESTMAELGVDAGDAVELRGAGSTVARVGAAFELNGGGRGSGRVYLSDDVRSNADSGPGDEVTVDSVTPTTARRVVLAPTQSVSLQGGADAVRQMLADRPLREGDTVRVRLFGGSMRVVFDVRETTPSGAVVAGDDTEVELLESPGADDDRAKLPDVRFADVGGLDDAVLEVRQLVEAPLNRPELYDRLQGHAPSGVLLHGPSGSGKTRIVGALADAVDAHVVAVTDPGTLSEYGDGDLSLEAVAETAIEQAPSLVVLDDVDALAPPREDASSRQSRAIARLVSVLDRLAEHDDVVVVGTTNRLDDVEDSLRRGGRFDREVEIGVPDRRGRFVGADLKSLITEAVRNAVDRIPPQVTLGDEPIDDEMLEKVIVTGDDFEAAVEAASPSAMRDVQVERPEVRFADIGGLDDAKHELLRAVEWPLRYPELFEKVGIETPKGLLLYGPPGTGKTMLVKAVANASDANFLSVNGPELLNRYVGESERGVREVFETARQNAPTIVFFDEVDAIASERGDGDNGVVERVVSQLLTELDGVRGRQDVVVVGATNRPDIVDTALLRPGRFEKLVEVPVPDESAREEIFEVHTREVPLGDVDLARLAARTEGHTGSDIEAVVREATMTAMEDRLRESVDVNPDTMDPSSVAVDDGHFDAALSTVGPSVDEEMRAVYDEIEADLRGG